MEAEFAGQIGVRRREWRYGRRRIRMRIAPFFLGSGERLSNGGRFFCRVRAGQSDGFCGLIESSVKKRDDKEGD
jgi:hypothetical protein